MIRKDRVIELVSEKLDKDMFIVDVSVTSTNVIQVFVDGFEGMPIEKCIEISRNVEHNLDRDEEDFELQVSSPGLTEPFKVLQQFQKNEGKEIELQTIEGQVLKGVVKNVSENDIEVETKTKEKVEGHKKKQLITRNYIFKYEEIKSAKATISFK